MESYITTNFQKNIWLLSNLNHSSRSNYNISSAYKFYGPISYDKLKDSIINVFKMHEIFQSRFHFDEELICRIEPIVECPYYFEDLSYSSFTANDDFVQQSIYNEIRHVFDLSEAPLVRIKCFKLSELECILVVTMHHIISDGHSFSVFLENILDNYFERTGISEPLQFSAYSHVKLTEHTIKKMEAKTNEWKDKGRKVEFLEFPLDYPRSNKQEFEGSMYSILVPQDLKIKLQEYAHKNGATIFMCLFAAYASLLYRYTGQKNFCIGTPTNMRSKRQTSIIGPCINMLPITVEINEKDSYCDLLKKIKLELIDALEHRYIDLDKIVENINFQYDVSRSSLYQTIFVWQNLTKTSYLSEDIILKNIDIHNGFVKLDLELHVKDNLEDGLKLICEYKTALFKKETIEALMSNYLRLIRKLLDADTAPIDTLNFFDSDFLEKLKYSWNNTQKKYNFDKAVINLFEEKVHQNPEHTAIIYLDKNDEPRSLSYANFNNKVNRLARYLNDTLDFSKGSIVAVLFERSLEMYLSIYAISKLGKAYLPIDPTWPKARINEILSDACPSAILTHSQCALLVEDFFFINVDLLEDKLSGLSTENFSPLIDLGNLPAYVIYTSGSTGKPKGVVNTHQALINRLFWMQEELQLEMEDRVLQKTPYVFDVSVWEIFFPLLFGATLVIAAKDSHRDCRLLQKIINENRITIVHFIPSMLHAYLAECAVEEETTLRYVICSGEELLSKTTKIFFDFFKKTKLYNLYGPTEACIDVTYWYCHPQEIYTKIPIGKPIANTKIYILDKNLNFVPENIIGEIYIAGENLAKGYLNKQLLTDESFFFHQFPGDSLPTRLYKTGDLAKYTHEGFIVYMGRKDGQVKLNGNRIEISEIESSLILHPNVKKAAVIIKTDPNKNGGKKIIGYIELVNSKVKTDEIELKNFLLSKLPSYMVFLDFVIISELPQTSGGKIDKKNLQEREIFSDHSSSEYFPPITEFELLLQEGWSRALNKETISRTDNFFRLGGDSIKILKVLSFLRSKKVELSIQDFFKTLDLSELAKKMKYKELVDLKKEISKFELIEKSKILENFRGGNVVDIYPLSKLQQGLYYFQQEEKYNYQIYLTWFFIKNKLDLSLLQLSVNYVVQRHSILRSYIDKAVYSELVQIVLKEVKVDIIYTELSFLPTDEAIKYHYEWLQEERNIPFNWEIAPLLRINVHQVSNEEYFLTLSEPWLDGWSVSILGSEILKKYVSLLENKKYEPPEILIDYSNFIKEEKNNELNINHKLFWREYLKNNEPCLIQHSEFNQNSIYRTYRHTYKLPIYFLSEIKRIAYELKVSIKHVLLAAHLFVIRFLTGKDNLITGLMSNSRPELPGAENIVGIFLNVLPFKIKIENWTWIEFIKNVYEQESNLLSHRFYPSANIIEDLGGQVLFNSLFNFTDFHLYREIPNSENFLLKEIHGTDQTYYTLTSHFSINLENNELRLDLDTNQNFEDMDWIKSIGDYYNFVLKSLIENSNSKINDIYYKIPYQKSLSGNEVALPENCLIDYFMRQLRLNHDKEAIIFFNQSWTYSDLAESVSNLITQIELFMGDKIVTHIAVYSTRSPNLIISLLALLTMGITYIPISTFLPEDSIKHILEDSQPQIILYEINTLEIKLSYTPIFLKITNNNSCNKSYLFDKFKKTKKNPALLMYTSGSTGKSKGVILSEQSLINRFVWMWEEYKFLPNEVVCSKTAINFIDSIWELLGGLLGGAKTILLSEEISKDIVKLTETLKKSDVTRITVVPTLLNEIVKYCLEHSLSLDKLLLCISSGEVLTNAIAKKFSFIAPQAKLLNLYGSTEVAGDVTYYEVTGFEQNNNIPLGIPLFNNEIYIVGENGYALPLQYLGNIMIKGANVAQGYTELAYSKEFFCSSVNGTGSFYKTGDLGAINKNGFLCYFGRIDRQIKIRGLRIEPYEIEAILIQIKGIRSVCVALKLDKQNEARLVAYYITENDNLNLDENLIRDFLKKKVPIEWIPEFFIKMKKFPLTISGKVDVAKLEFSLQNSKPHEVNYSLTPIEKELMELWKEVLDFDSPRVDRNFFINGGNSLKLMQLMLRIKRKFSIELTMKEIFNNITFHEMAELIRKRSSEIIKIV